MQFCSKDLMKGVMFLRSYKLNLPLCLRQVLNQFFFGIPSQLGASGWRQDTLVKLASLLSIMLCGNDFL